MMILFNRPKKYKNYQDALSHCKYNYEDSELCNMVLDKTLIYAKKEKTLNEVNIYLWSALNDFRLEKKTDSIRVLDFGGACGAHYFEMKELLSTVKFEWTVVETLQMTKSAKVLENSELHFTSNIDDVGEIDFIYASGSLQYTNSPYLFLEKLLNKKAGYLLFNRMMFGENDFITIQKSSMSKNGHGAMPEGYKPKMIEYPHTTMKFGKFMDMVKGYQLKWCIDSENGLIPIKGEKVFGKVILFKKQNGNSI